MRRLMSLVKRIAFDRFRARVSRIVGMERQSFLEISSNIRNVEDERWKAWPEIGERNPDPRPRPDL